MWNRCVQNSGGGTTPLEYEMVTKTPTSSWSVLHVCQKPPKVIVGTLRYSSASGNPITYFYDFERGKLYRSYDIGAFTEITTDVDNQKFRVNGNTIEFMAGHANYQRVTQYIILD